MKNIIFILIILSSCLKHKEDFKLNINSLLERKQTSEKDICILNSLFFFEDFIRAINENKGRENIEKIAQKILSNQRDHELIKISLNFKKFEPGKNHTFKWSNLIGILNKNIKKESEDFYYSDFYIKHVQLFAEFNKSSDIFTEKIYSFTDGSICTFQLEKYN